MKCQLHIQIKAPTFVDAFLLISHSMQFNYKIKLQRPEQRSETATIHVTADEDM
jgi:hypothetical protein